MTIDEVYEKYKHMDALFSQKPLLEQLFLESIIFDLWDAIKTTIKKDKEE